MREGKTDASLWAKAINSRNSAVEKGTLDLANLGAFIATEENRGEMIKSQLQQLDALKDAEPYHWEADVLKLAILSGKELPQDIPFHRCWLHSDVGWWWFGDNPPIVGRSSADANGQGVRINSLLYFFIASENRVKLVSFTLDHDEPTSGPVPIGIVTWQEGITLAYALNGVKALSENPQIKDYEFNKNTNISISKNEFWDPDNQDQSEVKFNNFDSDWAYTTAKTLWLFAAGSLWMQQKIIVTDPVHLPKSVHREARRLQVSAKSYVVQLRRKEYAPKEERGTVDWHYRWVVKGHWRNQPYKDGVKRYIFIHPFIKGPDDKPLKTPVDRVFHVMR